MGGKEGGARAHVRAREEERGGRGRERALLLKIHKGNAELNEECLSSLKPGDGNTGLSLGGLAGSFSETDVGRGRGSGKKNGGEGGTGLSLGLVRNEEEEDEEEEDWDGDRRRSSIGVLEHAMLNETLITYGIDDEVQ